MCVVVLIDSGVFQDFAFRADITVLLRHVGELVDAIQVRRLPLGIFFHPNVTCDAALIEPLQHFPIAVGGIGCHPLWPPTISFAVAIDHIACRCTLLTQPPSLVLQRSHSFHCRSDSYRSNPVRQHDFPWSGTLNPGRWSIPCLADGLLRHRRSPALVLPGTSAPHSSLALPPATV